MGPSAKAAETSSGSLDLITHVEATNCTMKLRFPHGRPFDGCGGDLVDGLRVSDRVAAVALVAGMRRLRGATRLGPSRRLRSTEPMTRSSRLPEQRIASCRRTAKPAALPESQPTERFSAPKTSWSMFSDQPVPEIVQTWAKRNGW